jgi:tripartite-type tricarboxylate transporter receptor subunit TctC
LPAFAQTGKVRALAVTYQKSTPLAPGIPPVADTVPGFELLGWYGLQAPLATSTRLIARINADVVKALKTQELQERLFAVGAEAIGSTPADLASFLQKETSRWEKVLREGGTIAVGKSRTSSKPPFPVTGAAHRAVSPVP